LICAFAPINRRSDRLTRVHVTRCSATSARPAWSRCDARKMSTVFDPVAFGETIQLSGPAAPPNPRHRILDFLELNRVRLVLLIPACWCWVACWPPGRAAWQPLFARARLQPVSICAPGKTAVLITVLTGSLISAVGRWGYASRFRRAPAGGAVLNSTAWSRNA